MPDTSTVLLPAARRGRLSIEARTLIVRALRLTLRDTDSLITALALPVLLMLMFVYLFEARSTLRSATSTTSFPACCSSASDSVPEPRP